MSAKEVEDCSGDEDYCAVLGDISLLIEANQAEIARLFARVDEVNASLKQDVRSLNQRLDRLESSLQKAHISPE